MVVDRSYKVQAGLSLGPNSPTITFETGTTTIVLSDMRCTIQVGLSGPDFEIAPDEPTEQSFIGTRELLWDWQVRPTRIGDDLIVTLTVQAKVVRIRVALGPQIPNRFLISVEAVPESGLDRLSSIFDNQIVAGVTAGAMSAAAGRGRWLRSKARKESIAENHEKSSVEKEAESPGPAPGV